MFPLRDYTRRRRIVFPFVNVTLIVINVLVFFYELALGPDLNNFVLSLGLIPYEIVNNVDLPPQIPVPVYATLVTSMFLHANLLHIGGNMLFLWVFGDNIEDSMGHLRYLAFYLLVGIIAAFSQIIVYSDSQVPTIGASGAVAGILGAYFVLFPRGRITTLLLLGFIPLIVRLPALVLLGYWIILQIFLGIVDIGQITGVSTGVAVFAHIGGFLSGAALIFAFRVKYPRYRFTPPGT